MKLSPIINHLIALAYAGLLDGPVWTLSISFPEGSPYEKLRGNFSLAEAKMEFGPYADAFAGKVETSVKCGGLLYQAKSGNPDILIKLLETFFKVCLANCRGEVRHVDIDLHGIATSPDSRTTISYQRRINAEEGGDDHGD